MDKGKRYVLPRKLTGNVPERSSNRALLPLGKAGEISQTDLIAEKVPS